MVKSALALSVPSSIEIDTVYAATSFPHENRTSSSPQALVPMTAGSVPSSTTTTESS
jgi:hypothetical protein